MTRQDKITQARQQGKIARCDKWQNGNRVCEQDKRTRNITGQDLKARCQEKRISSC